MRICGIKTTHDGSVALIEDGRLVFSYEMEKIGNNERYAKIGDLAEAFDLLEQHGFAVDDVDHYVLDGWHKTHKVRPWHGQEVEIVLAPYRRGLLGDDVFAAFPNTVADLTYDSYTHYAGHVAAGYCTSPFAERGEDAFVLCWDGWMLPFLFHVTADGTARTVGALHPLIGNSYHELCRPFPPFDPPIEFPHILGLAGKIMAYAAVGKPQEHVIEHLRDQMSQAAEAVLGADWRTVSDRRLQVDTGVAILEKMRKAIDVEAASADDMIASIHEFLQRELVSGLGALLDAYDSTVPTNLCVVGGCGLNIKWNSALRDSGLVQEVWVPPFPNDAGSAIGTAAVAMMKRTPTRAIAWDVYSGPELLPSEPLSGWSHRECSIEELARLMHDSDEPVVFLNGRAELGPRALGNRSILAPATSARMKEVLNEVKEREWYRPVAPICLEDRAPEVFDPGTPDPYMLFDHQVREQWVDRVPAICHLDGTARLQTVNASQNPLVHDLLTAYAAISGVPLLCNTSANFKHSGFFPDVRSAMEWGRVRLIWSEGELYSRDDSTAESS